MLSLLLFALLLHALPRPLDVVPTAAFALSVAAAGAWSFCLLDLINYHSHLDEAAGYFVALFEYRIVGALVWVCLAVALVAGCCARRGLFACLVRGSAIATLITTGDLLVHVGRHHGMHVEMCRHTADPVALTAGLVIVLITAIVAARAPGRVSRVLALTCVFAAFALRIDESAAECRANLNIPSGRAVWMSCSTCQSS